MKKFHLLISILLLFFAIFFNLYFLFPETNIKSEVNDNVFAYGLILRMNKAWDEGHCPLSLNCLPKLLDHWNSSWAMGYPLPHFYQHIPDLTVVAIFRFLDLFSKITLHTVFEWFKYLMLSLIPLSYFISAKKFGFSNLAAGFTALASTQVSTQYLYGTDYNALVWRGSGMYTQLWGIFFLPLAVSSIYQFVSNLKFQISNLIQSILFLSLVISSHVVFGFITLGSAIFIPIALSLSQKVSIKILVNYFKKLFLPFTFCFLTLAYWLIPLLQHSALRNKSIWDDLNKFDSFGFQQIIKWFFNGQIFDANRLPVLTIIVIVGFFLMLYLWSKQKEEKNYQNQANSQYLLFPLLFVFWFLLYFGRKTWGPIIDLVPMMEDMHIHRFINGVHFAGIFIIGFTLDYIINFFGVANVFSAPSRDSLAKGWEQALQKIFANRKINSILTIILTLVILIPVFKERKEYLEYNSGLISEYNKSWDTDMKDFQKILDYLGPSTKSRVYPGRPGNWGNNFYVGSTRVFLEMAQRGYDTFAFLPETWSLNSDIEQYFDENKEDNYNVFNVGYYLAPPEQKPPSFAKEVYRSGKYILYKIASSQNFELVDSPLTVSVNKKTFLNPNIAWLKSDWPKNHLFPTIFYESQKPAEISMLDSSTYQTKDGIFPLFSPNPFSTPKEPFQIPNREPSGRFQINNEVVTPSSYSADITALNDSLLTLKVTYHPYWQAKIDGQPAKISMVSPSFMAIQVPKGDHKIEFTYTPSNLKIILIYLSLFSLISLISLNFLKTLHTRNFSDKVIS